MRNDVRRSRPAGPTVLAWALAAVLAGALAGCGAASPVGQQPVAARPTTAPPLPSAAAGPSSPARTTPPRPSASPTAGGMTTAVPSRPAAPTTPAEPADTKLRRGDSGPAVLAAQRRLSELGYWLDTPDGHYGLLTEQAVVALQKAAGLDRDGVLGPRTRAALDRGSRPSARGTGTGIEIDLRRQLLLVVGDGAVRFTLNTSTGSNRNYTYEGQTYLAETPTGRFEIYRQIDGLREGPLGDLYRPKYFTGGIAVHGSPSVPAYPASHGCARVTNAAINWIWSRDVAPVGTPVRVY